MNKLLLKQEHAIYYLKDSTTRELLYGGAAGGGKSKIGCVWIMECCQKYPGSRWLIGRSKLKNLEETTLNTFFDTTKELGLSSSYTYNAQKHIIYWNNGSEILLKDLFHYPSDREFDSLGSLEITGAFIDEVPQINYKAWQIVRSRIRYKLKEWDIHGEKTITMKVIERDKEGIPVKWLNSKGEVTEGLTPKMLGTCNPSKNWPYKYFYKPYKKNSLPISKKFIQALPKDNPYLPQSYLDSLMELNKNSRERLYYGNWEYDNDPATLIDNDSISNYFKPNHLKTEGQKYMTIDVARKGKDKTVFRIWHGWVCTHRYSINKSGLDVVVKQAKAYQLKHNIMVSNIVADEDGVGGGVVDFLRCKGFINNSRALNDENYDNLKSQCSIKMALKIVAGEVGEIVDPKDDSVYEITREEMEQVKMKDIDKDGKQGIVSKDKVKEAIGRSPDEWDSIMMRYYFEMQKNYSTRILS